MAATDDVRAALATLLGASSEPASDVRDDAASIAAVVSRNSPGAADAWATTFGVPAATFERGGTHRRRLHTADRRACSPGCWRLTADGAAAYARAVAELAIAAASLGELTISALGTATVLGNAQLLAADLRPPDASLFARPSAGTDTLALRTEQRPGGRGRDRRRPHRAGKARACRPRHSKSCSPSSTRSSASTRSRPRSVTRRRCSASRACVRPPASRRPA